MAILDTVKKGYLTLKTATGYVKLLPRTLASLVSTSDGYASCFAEINKNGNLDLAVRFQKTAVGDIFYINMCYICQ